MNEGPKELHESNESQPDPAFHTQLLNLVNDLVLSVSLDAKKLLYVNAAAQAIYGRELNAFTENPNLWFEAVHPDDQPQLAAKYRDIRKFKKVSQRFRVVQPNGNIRWLQATIRVVTDRDNQPQSIGCIAKDVTRYVSTEMALEEATAIYHSLVESLPINVFRKDRDGRIIFGNQRYCDTLGKSLKELVGFTDHDLFSKDLADKYCNDDRWVLQTGLPFHDIEEHPSPDGSKIYVEVLKAPVTDSDGRRVGIQGMFWDVTTRKRAEEALRDSKEIAEAASRAKSDFLANMSHEIRTPLNAIIGMTELLAQSPIDSGQKEYLTMVQQSGESLLTLINDILDFSKIEAGKLAIDKQSFNIRDALADTMRTLALRAHEKDLELAMRVDPKTPQKVIGDAIRIRQIIVNLVGNAIKFTHQGEVVLDIEVEAFNEIEVKLKFSVSDTGVGISDDKIEKIFAEFEQADSSTTRQYGGTGLGLAIGSRLVELMGGRMQVNSQLGQGSRFFFTLEFPVDPKKDAESNVMDSVNATVLIVDDNKTSLRVVEEILRDHGFRTLTASDAESAIKVLSALASGSDPVNLVVCDSDMPDKDGFQLVREIRQNESITATPTILLTAGSQHGDSSVRRELDIHSQLFKPVKESELLECIASALGVEKSKAPSKIQQTAAIGQPTSLKILLAEDNIMNQKLAVGLLSKHGHDVHVVSNGRQCVEAYQGETFDAILMDIQMPEMDGLEATREIRRLESNNDQRIRIVAMTAHAMVGDRERCLDAGMDEYVSKPIRVNKLMHALGVGQVPGSGNDITPSVSNAVLSPIIHWDDAYETVGGDRELLSELIDVFLAERGQMVSDIRTAIEAKNGTELRRCAHAIKGALNHLGAKRVAKAAQLLEEMGESDQLGTSQDVLHELNAEIELLTTELIAFTNNFGDQQ